MELPLLSTYPLQFFPFLLFFLLIPENIFVFLPFFFWPNLPVRSNHGEDAFSCLLEPGPLTVYFCVSSFNTAWILSLPLSMHLPHPKHKHTFKHLTGPCRFCFPFLLSLFFLCYIHIWRKAIATAGFATVPPSWSQACNLSGHPKNHIVTSFCFFIFPTCHLPSATLVVKPSPPGSFFLPTTLSRWLSSKVARCSCPSSVLLATTSSLGRTELTIWP